MVKNFRDKYKLQEKDVLFIFKGGNILRIIAKDFFLELPENTSRNILDFYRPFFKRSDADFSILVNPNLPHFDKYSEELAILCYDEQVKIKKIFLENEMRYFDLFCYNDSYNRILFSDLIEKLNVKNISLGKIFYKKGINYKHPDDFEFVTIDGTPTKKKLDENDSYLFTSINNTFDEVSESGWRTKFNLIRTKVRFIVTDKRGKNKNIDGELIDVTIANKESSEIIPFYKDIDKNISVYTLKRKNEEVKFYSYSIEYLIKDLEKILFLQGEYPWNDSKYIKRLNRLIFLYFIDLFSKVENSNTRLEILKDASSFLDGKKVDIENNIKIADLFKYILKTEEKIDSKNKGNLDEMLNVINENLTFLIESLENIKVYCKTDGNVSKEDISSIDMENYV